jgi:hypothetical protein
MSESSGQVHVGLGGLGKSAPAPWHANCFGAGRFADFTTTDDPWTKCLQT